MVQRQKDWLAAIPKLNSDDLVFLDESGFKDSIHQERGWDPVGQTPTIIAPYRGRNVTVIAAIRVSGDCGLTALEGYMNKADFLQYLRDVLGPQLREGDWVVMDNLRSHTSKEAHQILADFGAKPLFLPPYSPEYNPIELCWGIMKARFRRLPLLKGIDAVFDRVVSLWKELDRALFRRCIEHCGYRLGTST